MTWRVVIERLCPDYGLSVYFSIYDPSDDEGDPSFEGSVKWDGCVNWKTQRNCYAHFCSPDDVRDFADAMTSVWALARPLLGDKADPDCYGK